MSHFDSGPVFAPTGDVFNDALEEMDAPKDAQPPDKSTDTPPAMLTHYQTKTLLWGLLVVAAGLLAFK